MRRLALKRPRSDVTPSFVGLASSSEQASLIARRLSRKVGTRCELGLSKALRARGLRAQRSGPPLVGNPDFRFVRERVVVFCDGDFWHGRHLRARLARLKKGSNASYWTQKLASNVARDSRVNIELKRLGWLVVRIWETDINRAPERAAAKIELLLRRRRPRNGD